MMDSSVLSALAELVCDFSNDVSAAAAAGWDCDW